MNECVGISQYQVPNSAADIHQQGSDDIRDDAHKALSVREFVATKQITVLEHPVYSPDLAPPPRSDFFFCSRK